MYNRDFAARAVNSWRFPADNPEGELPIDGAYFQTVIAGMMATGQPYVGKLGLACDLANWLDECRAAALGG